MGAVNAGFLLATLAAGSVGEALSNVVSSLGLMAVIFYGLTAAAAVWQGRHTLCTSWRTALLGGLLPAAGAICMGLVAVESVLTGALTRSALAYGIGAISCGLLLALMLDRIGRVPFFRAHADSVR